MSTETQTNSRDWFLISIAAGIGLLIIVSLILALRGPVALSYQTGTGPEDIALNYLIAFQLEDYDRAYQSLWSGLEGRPETAGLFFDEAQGFSEWQCRIGEQAPSTFSLIDTDTFEDRAVVTIEESFGFQQPGLFGSGGVQTRSNTIQLIETESGWQITESERCWNFDWRDVETAG